MVYNAVYCQVISDILILILVVFGIFYLTVVVDILRQLCLFLSLAIIPFVDVSHAFKK